ncbi:hypothetical protein B9Z65_3227 [Elsinoe australis]|uniref:Impact N-terminal domain-containing protein n=1 Tax=Elsinoe australis TaxID=40998 RepID=A0A2P7ZUR2_9PEZI|nr:hypothetical protein B9Z65_3227 [Elsinoe australis]
MASARYGYMHVSPRDLPTTSTAPTSTKPSLKRPRSPSPPTSSFTSSPEIFISSPLHDRQSTFTAYFSPKVPPHDLQSIPAIASASHRILAYRIPISAPLSSTKKSRQSTLGFTSAGGGGGKQALQAGQDDDGESYGAKHLMKVLVEMDAVGSLVVARWYGGVMLGPARFRHMESVGREAVGKFKEGGQGEESGAGQKGKRQDGETGTGETLGEERKRLVVELEERDESILSLRKLLEQKKGLLASLEGGAEGAERSSQSSPAKKIEYDKMPIDRLRLLDQARDRTIGFLLKQIDEVEEKIVAWDDAGIEKDDVEDEDAKQATDEKEDTEEK